MNLFTRYKSEHVADFLRDAIKRGQLAEPLPALREWSSSLGVSPNTLQAALTILKQEGLVYSLPKKGIHLCPRAPARKHPRPRVVRWIWPSLLLHRSESVFAVLRRRLAAQKIDFQPEYWDAPRMRDLRRSVASSSELLVFSDLRLAYQKALVGFKNVILVGLPLPGIELPYLSCDVYSAIRHAIHHLQRRGHDRIDVLNPSYQKENESILRLEQEFNEIRQGAHRPFKGSVQRLPTEYSELCRAIRGMAARFKGRQGLVVNAPISPGLLIMVFQSCGLRIPEDVEIIPVNAMPHNLVVYPPLEYYPFPMESLSRALVKAAIHYFEAGRVPDLRKLISLSLVSSPPDRLLL